MRNIHETILFVDLKKLKKNFNYITSRLDPNCEIIAVVKAFGYGHGDVEISKSLESFGVKSFWVADFDEAIELRKGGIKSKIIIANPGYKSFDEIIKYNLDVVVYNKKMLSHFIKHRCPINIHIKFNTGMNRYGFDITEIDHIAKKINENSFLNLISICSHLASSQDVKDSNFTLNQISNFKLITKKMELNISSKFQKHILNSYGLLNFPKHQMDSVRVGIGLYGACNNKNLNEISYLETIITQQRSVKKGDRIGYSGKYIANENMIISIIPIGYADGLNRHLGNGAGSVLVKNTLCPIIGDISMDSCIIDTSKVKCKEGDNVRIFSENNPVINLSEKLDTIPYEIYATLNRRIKRVYLN